MSTKQTHCYVVNIGTEKSPIYEAYWKTGSNTLKHVLVVTPDFNKAIAALDAIEKQRGAYKQFF